MDGSSGVRLAAVMALLATPWFSALAVEPPSQTYNFDGWVVTVTPGASKTVSRPAAGKASSPEVVPASFQAAPPAPAEFPEMPPAPVSAPQPATTADVQYFPPGPEGRSPAVKPDARVSTAKYEEVYEYDANPSYRHDATMEFLFGQMRPTVIQRSTTRVDVNMPEALAYPGMGYPHLYNLPYFPWYTPGGRVYRGQ